MVGHHEKKLLPLPLSGVFLWNFLFGRRRGYSISLCCVLFSPFPFLSPHVSLFIIYSFCHRFVLAFSLKLHIRLFNFFSSFFFLFFCNHSNSYFLHSFHLIPHPTICLSTFIKFIQYFSFIHFFFSLFLRTLHCPFHILIFLIFFFFIVKKNFNTFSIGILLIS